MPRLAKLRRIAVMGALLLSLLVFVWYLTEPTRGEHDHIKSSIHDEKKTTTLQSSFLHESDVTSNQKSSPTSIEEKIREGEGVNSKEDKGEKREREREGERKKGEREKEQETERIKEQKESLFNYDSKERRQKVKEMIKHAWYGYYNYTMGHNELKPISKSPEVHSIFGGSPIGATLVDSLDTLYIAGLTTEFEIAKRWVKEHFDLHQVSTGLSFFEVNIRFIGGFISAYLLSEDIIFINKAIEVAKLFSPAFSTSHGLPNAIVNMQNGQSNNWGWVPGRCSILSEIGSLHLEHVYISLLSNDSSYINEVLNVRRILREHKTSEGVYYTLINPSSLQWCNDHISLGALSDSFYEYLLKAWLLSDKMDTEAKDMFYEAIDGLEKTIFHFVSSQKFLLISESINGQLSGNSMEHLTCFSGGLYALASVHATNGKSQHYMEIAKNITRTCHESYIKTVTKLGADYFEINEEGVLRSSKSKYILRPETVESYFYLWRLTHDPMYREWGWELVQALETQCRISSGGYSGLKDVNIPRSHDDVQQSFFIAETLKYLYLLFSDDAILPLDQWVFNTEGHLLRVVHK